MNTSALILGTIGVKNTFDFVSGITKVLSKTSNVSNSNKKKDLKTFFEDNDIDFKLINIKCYCDLHKDNMCYDQMKDLFEKIYKVLDDIKFKQELNHKMKFKYFNWGFDSEIEILDSLIKRLETRFELFIKVN